MPEGKRARSPSSGSDDGSSNSDGGDANAVSRKRVESESAVAATTTATTTAAAVGSRGSKRPGARSSRSKFEDLDLSTITQNVATVRYAHPAVPSPPPPPQSSKFQDAFPPAAAPATATSGSSCGGSGADGAGAKDAGAGASHGQSMTEEERAALEEQRRREIEEFVPTIPRSLMSTSSGGGPSGGGPSGGGPSGQLDFAQLMAQPMPVIKIGAAARVVSVGGADGSAGANVAGGALVVAGAGGSGVGGSGSGSGSGQLALLPGRGLAAADLVATGGLPADKAKTAREMRKLHVSGFPATVTRDELLLNLKHRCVLARQAWLKAADKAPENDTGILNEIDDVVDLHVNLNGKQPFAFAEFSMADVMDHLVDGDNDAQFADAHGQPYLLRLRRPKEYRAITGIDRRKAVVCGFPLTIGDAKLRKIIGEYGEFQGFQRKGMWTYVEYESEEAVKSLIEELSGEVLRQRLMVVHPLHAWLRPVLGKEGITIPPPSASDALDGALDGSGGAAGEDGAELSRARLEDELVFDMLGLEHRVPEVLRTVTKLYPHLAPSMGAVPIFPTRTLVLLNCIDTNLMTKLADFDELLLDRNFETLRAEIEAEVEKHGRVKELIIPRARPQPPQPPEPFVPRKIEKPPAVAEMLPLQNPFAAGKSARNTGNSNSNSNGNGNASDSGGKEDLGDEYRQQQLAEYEAALEAEEARQAEFDAAMREYHKACAAFRDKVSHPVWGTSGIGRIFVEYESVDEAALAQRQLAGRLFNGRTIITSFLFEDILHPPEPEEAEAAAMDDSSDEQEEDSNAAAEDHKGRPNEEADDAKNNDAAGEGGAEQGDAATGTAGDID